MHKQSKKAYQAPSIKVVEVKVEHAFQSFTAGTLATPPENGTETYAAGDAYGWF